MVKSVRGGKMFIDKLIKSTFVVIAITVCTVAWSVGAHAGANRIGDTYSGRSYDYDYGKTNYTNISIYFDGVISERNPKVDKLLTALDRAREGDRVTIFINSGGGSLFLSGIIVDEIKSSKAYVVTYNIGWAASGAMPIALAGDCIKAKPKALYLFHRPVSHNLKFKGLRPKSSTEADLYFIRVLNKAAGKFLTKIEKKWYYEGRDIVYPRRLVYERLSSKVCGSW